MEIICVGSVLWDIIGRSGVEMRHGSDVGGRITRLPGGVALNIAMTLAQFGMRPVLLSAVGNDVSGNELVSACQELGLITDHIYRSDLPTDQYMAVEGSNGLIAAIADAHSLEAAGNAILEPLVNGKLGSVDTPFTGRIVLDGNMTTEVLRGIAGHSAFGHSQLLVAPASPGKAERLSAFFKHPNVVIYLNIEEAGLLCGCEFRTSSEAASALHTMGMARVLVTDGAKSASESGLNGTFSVTPPQVIAKRVTGAGDTFMAAHISAEMNGAAPDTALERAAKAAAIYVSGEHPL